MRGPFACLRGHFGVDRASQTSTSVGQSSFIILRTRRDWLVALSDW
jgi:hypothetical protein